MTSIAEHSRVTELKEKVNELEKTLNSLREDIVYLFGRVSLLENVKKIDDIPVVKDTLHLRKNG